MVSYIAKIVAVILLASSLLSGAGYRAGVGFMPICTADGVQYLALDANQNPIPDNTPIKQDQTCLWCLLNKAMQHYVVDSSIVYGLSLVFSGYKHPWILSCNMNIGSWCSYYIVRGPPATA